MAGAVNYPEMIRVWMEVYHRGGSTQDVADDMGITREALLRRAQHMRRKGVKLPPLAGAAQLTTAKVEELNRLILELDQSKRFRKVIHKKRTL